MVHDQPDVIALVTYHLAKTGYRVGTTANGREALKTVRQERPDLIILGITGPSDFDVITELRRREETREVGLVVLASGRRESDRIRALALGADDCLLRPFAPRELVLRVAAILRRLSAPALATGERLSAGAIVLDTATRSATVDGVELSLTATEFKLLRVLLEGAGRVQSRAQLLEAVWQAHPSLQTRTVDMHMQRLRSKLGSEGWCIETVRGAGYRFRAEPKNGAGPSRRTQR